MKKIFDSIERIRTPFRVAKDSRIYAVGDIHGRLDLLSNLLEKIWADEEASTSECLTQLVFLGDYVDRGDASQGVLHRLLELKALGQESVILLKGNHEEAMLDFIVNPQDGAKWLQMGGQQTLASFGISMTNPSPVSADIPVLHQEFCDAIQPYLQLFSNMPSYHLSGSYLFCHAGVNPAKPISEQSDRALLWGHPDGNMDQPIVGKRIVHGHYDNPIVRDYSGRICIDTGAYYTGVLTALRVDGSEHLLQTVSP
ncbi:MAG: serine/threonine protein phosphatase [Boseongicola sp.]|nr:serine/threonine protein phosphatase [Boseongicola sp.]